MSDHVPFPEDDRSRTPFHGDPRSVRQRDADRKAGIFADLNVADVLDLVELEVDELLGDIDTVDSCPGCYQHAFFPGAPKCSTHWA